MMQVTIFHILSTLSVLVHQNYPLLQLLMDLSGVIMMCISNMFFIKLNNDRINELH
jgi:hypothetical protein